MNGDQLRSMLESRNMTHRQLADKLGVNRVTVTRWVNNVSAIDRFKATAINAVLNTDN